MSNEGYGTWSVRLCVCLSVCFTLILELQATKRHVNGTLVFSATSARKIMWQIWLKRLRSRKRNRHRRGPRFKTQPINYRGAHACLLHAWACACSTGSALGAAQPGVLRCCITLSVTKCCKFTHFQNVYKTCTLVHFDLLTRRHCGIF